MVLSLLSANDIKHTKIQISLLACEKENDLSPLYKEYNLFVIDLQVNTVGFNVSKTRCFLDLKKKILAIYEHVATSCIGSCHIKCHY